jgi:Asp-tRNA(Asn)/Glu-tRNA(Gln) amidotransferase A subunit family amidase
MTLAWTMDKAGPITRSAEDCALVFAAVQGPDTFDQAVKDVPFNWNATMPLSSLRFAYIEPQLQRTSQTDSTMIRPPVSDGIKAAIAALESHGAKVRMIPPLPTANQYAGLILDAECAAAFQADTLTDKIKELETPRDFLGRPGGYSTWATTFRRGQFVPAAEYINAMRARTILMQQYWDAFKDVDVVIMNSGGGATGENTSVTNLTGTPCITVPTALTVPPAQGGRGGGGGRGGAGGAATDTANRAPAPPPPPRAARPGSVRFLGALYRDDHVLRAAHAFQQATTFHKEKPPLFP